VRAPISQTPGTVGPLLRLVWPVLAEQVLVMLVGFSDTLLAGHYLSPSHLAAMTVISYALWMLTNLFSFVSIGAVAMTARFVGAGDWPAANRVVAQSFVLGGILAFCFTASGLVWGERLVGLLQLEGEPAALATRYLRVLVPVLPMMMLEAVGIGCLRGAGDMVTMVLVNVINITVAWSLLLGLGPLLQMGWDALPIGAACGHATAGLIPLVVLLRGRPGFAPEFPVLSAVSESETTDQQRTLRGQCSNMSERCQICGEAESRPA
jgi:Na+-driven multidrug efflux pump